MLEDSQCPPHKEDLPDAARFTSLWSTKNPASIKESKIFWILLEMDLHMVINKRPRLSPILFMQLMAYAEFKVNFHSVSIRAWKDPKHTWHKLPYLVSMIDVQEIVGYWPTESHEPRGLMWEQVKI